MTPTNCVNAGYLRRELGVQHRRAGVPLSLQRGLSRGETRRRDQSSPWNRRKMVLRNQR